MSRTEQFKPFHYPILFPRPFVKPIVSTELFLYYRIRYTIDLKGASMNALTNLDGKVAWQKIVAAYARPDLPRSIWQIINTLIPFFILFYLSLRSLEVSF